MPGKVYRRNWIEGVIERSERQIREEHSGFRKGRRYVTEKMAMKKRRVFVTFIDLERLYDKV